MKITRNKLFIFIGTAFFIAGSFVSYRSLNISMHGETTKGNVVSYGYSSDGKSISYNVVLNYKCGNKEYTESSSFGSNKKPYSIGEELEIYCIGKDFIRKGSVEEYFGFIFVGIGLMVLLITFVNYATKTRRLKMIKELKYKGDFIMATVMQISCDTSFSIGGRNPTTFTCRYIDKNTQKSQVFKSKKFRNDISACIKVGDERKIYINKANKRDFVIDTEDLPIDD